MGNVSQRSLVVLQIARPQASRIVWILWIWIILIAVLLGRLFRLMIFPSIHGLTGGAGWSPVTFVRWHMDAMHFHRTMVDDGRGQIFFRDGEPWSGKSHITLAGNVETTRPVIAPELIGLIGVPDRWVSHRSTVPEVGRSGLEWSLDKVLSAQRPQETGTLVPAANSNLDVRVHGGTQVYRLSPVRGTDVVTTLNSREQALAESLLRREGIQHGSIVSIALPSNELSVLASANHVKSDALRAIAPGSVFKLVTASAALDTHTTHSHRRIVCDGVVHLLHVHMHCWRTHGSLSFVQAIAQSCDVTFAEIGVRLGRHALENAAARFGLGSTGLIDVQGKPAVPGADTGVVFRHSGDDNGLLANTAIGQEDVRMSPLEGAIMAKTIATGGRYERPALILGKKQGGKVRLDPIHDPLPHQACEPFTAAAVAEGMWNAVHQPSGTAYALHLYPIGAKTGTAERPNGNVNAWLVGFRIQHRQPVEAFAFCIEDLPSARAHAALYRIAASWFLEHNH